MSGPTPRKAKLSPDGRCVTLLKNRADDKDRFDLWAIDTATGAARMLVDSKKIGSGGEISEEEKMRRERARIAGTKGITDYGWAPDSRSILVPIDGDLYLATLDGSVRRLTETAATEIDPKVSETGRYPVASSATTISSSWTRPAGSERALTSDGGRTLSWGAAEFVAQEELGRDTGYWWSPDDRYIAVARVDESPVAIVKRAAIGASGTELIEQRYPVAGTKNAIVDLYLMTPDGQSRVKADLGADPDYLSRPRRLGEGRPQPLRPAPQPRPEAARHASRRSGDRPIDRAVLRNLADLGQPHRQFQAAQGRQPDLVVGAQRLFASLSLEGRQMDAADARRVGGRGRRRSR